MKTKYRDFEIEAQREDDQIFYEITRMSDGATLGIGKGIGDNDRTVREVIDDCKVAVDDYYDNPDDYALDEDEEDEEWDEAEEEEWDEDEDCMDVDDVPKKAIIYSHDDPDEEPIELPITRKTKTVTMQAEIPKSHNYLPDNMALLEQLKKENRKHLLKKFQ